MRSKSDWFDYYVDGLGWQIVLVAPGEKRPQERAWNDDRSYNPFKWRRLLQEHPEDNLGVLLGKAVVDLEGDTAEACEVIEAMIGDLHHPICQSRNSRHHFFRPPFPGFYTLQQKEQGIEFRGLARSELEKSGKEKCGTQTLLPPSVVNGFERFWLVEPTPDNIPVLPPALVGYWQEHRTPLKGKPRPTSRGIMLMACAACRKLVKGHATHFAKEVFAFRRYGQTWRCVECRQVNVRAVLRQVEKQHGIVAVKRLAKELARSNKRGWDRLLRQERLT